MYRIVIALIFISALADKAYSDTNYKLNTPIRPKTYSITITPYFDTGNSNAFTFEGEVDITFITVNVTNQIKLHSEDLIYDASNITVTSGSNNLNLDSANPLEFDKNYTFAYINLEADLQVGVEYHLKITYTGPIRDDLTGFYRNYYFENGIKKWLGATHMWATHARNVFPCFDEPGLKATFALTIDRPETYKPTLANSKLKETVALSNGYVREIFYPTIMPTYMLAFLVSEYDGNVAMFNGTTAEFGVFTRPEVLNQTEYALDFGMRVVKALGDYFEIDYYSIDPNLKLDHVALPDFRVTAMENWGLVKYRESLLLYVPEDSSPYIKFSIAQTVAHETTHMWFGDLVTYHWWSDAWLNEGFANYFQDYITAMIEPEMGSANVLVTGSVYAAYDADSIPSAAPISNNKVYSPEEIVAHFDTISYEKASSVIRMTHHLMGDDAFKFGLNRYLEANKFGSGNPRKMYEALDIGAKNHSALAAYPDTDIAEVMSSWISQPGHPILHVDINYEDGTVVLTQRRFYQSSRYSSNETYNIPITYTTQKTADFDNTKPAFIMNNTQHVFTIANISQDCWVIFNVQETGLYRVNYDDHSWQMISRALKRADKNKIHHLNRAKIVNDLFALLYADKVKFAQLKDALDSLSTENNFSVWYAAIRGFRKLWNSYIGSDALADIQAYILQMMGSAIEKLGYELRSTDDFETVRNRMQVLEFSCKLGHAGCVEHAEKLFRGLKENGTEVPPSLRPVAYCNGLRRGDAVDYDFLWNRMITTNVVSEARVIGESLGCTSDKAKLKSYLASMLVENSPIRTLDLTLPLATALSDHKNLPLILDELKRNYTLWTSIYKTMDVVLSKVASALHTEGDFAEFEAFLSSCSDCTANAKTSAMDSLRVAHAEIAWANSHKEDTLSSIRT